MHFPPIPVTVFDQKLRVHDAEGKLYAPSYTILYRGTEHLWALVSAGVLEPIPTDTEGPPSLGETQKLYADFRLRRGGHL